MSLLQRVATRGPAQSLITGGLIAGLFQPSSSTGAEDASRPTPSPPATPSFVVKNYQLQGNSVLRESDIEQLLRGYTGGSVTFNTIREALTTLQLEYRKRGFVTVAVSLPPQQLTNGVVQVNVMEGRLAEINVVGNRYYSSNNVRRALPSLSTNLILNSLWFQPELDRANQSTDRQISPVIAPGSEAGTSVLNLKVKDRLPLHGRFALDNRATPNTPPLRIDTAVVYNNLWQREHQVGLQYNFSPQETKADSELPRFWDQPRVASYSGYYRIPLGSGSTQRSEYEKLNGTFGFDPVTRQFRAPQASGNSELILYASRSLSDTRTRFGPLNVLTNSAILDVTQQSAQRDITQNENLGAKFNLPVAEFSGVRSTLTLGADYKFYHAQSLSTNLTYVDTYATDLLGERIAQTGHSTIPLDNPSERELFYVPLSLSWSASRPDKTGVSFLSLNDNVYIGAFGSGRNRFRAVAGRQDAGGTHTALSGTLGRDQRIFKNWILSARASGQWASAPLIGNEQFALGGSSGVRGYEEGEEYGDAGWKLVTELRAPAISIGYLPHGYRTIPLFARGSLFYDNGARYLYDLPASKPSAVRMSGVGFGLLVTAGENFEARLNVGWALRDTPGTSSGSARAYFSIGTQF